MRGGRLLARPPSVLRAWNGPLPGKLGPGGELMEQYEQYYRLPQDVVGHDAALLSYWEI